MVPFPDEKTSRISLSNCIGEIGERFYTKGEIISIYLSSSEANNNSTSATVLDRILLPELFQKYAWSILVSNEVTVSSNDWKRTDSYIVHFRNVEEVEATLQTLQAAKSWNAHARFVVVSATIFENPEQVVATVVQHMWHAKIVNAIVILSNPSDKTEQQIFTWYPFADGNCGNNFDKAVMIEKCRFGKFETGVDLFPEKVPLKLKNCAVRVRVLVWPPFVMPPTDHVTGTELYEFNSGLEIDLMNTIAEKANFKPLYTMSPNEMWGDVYNNGSTTGLFKELAKKRSDIAIGSVALSKQRMDHFDVTTSYIQDSLVWCVPHSKSEPPFQKLSNTMHVDTWCTIILSFFIFSVTVWCLGRLQKAETSAYKSLPGVLQNSLSMVLGMAVKALPRTTTIRIFMWFWIMASLILDITYTTYLMSMLTSSSYGKQVKTLDDIFTNKLKILVLPGSLKYLNDSSWKMQKIMKEYKPCDNMDSCLYKVAYQRDAAVCIPQLYLEYVFHKYLSSTNEPLLYCFRDSIVDYPIQMFMSKGYPLRSRINTLVERIIDAGLIVLWEKRIFDNSWGNTTIRNEDSESTNRMKLEHLYPIFVTLIVGEMFAALVFVVEVVKSKFKVNIW